MIGIGHLPKLDALTKLGANGRGVTYGKDRRGKPHASRKKLSLFGVSAFVAHEDILATKAWQQEIENALRSKAAFAAMMTRVSTIATGLTRWLCASAKGAGDRSSPWARSLGVRREVSGTSRRLGRHGG
jgi:hypothetical protein